MIKYILIFVIISVSAQDFIASYVGAGTGNNLADDQLAYYKFDETTGAPQDSSGNGRHLTDYGTTETGTGKIINTRFHDSTENDDYFGVASAAWNTFGSNNFTIAFWVRATAPSGVINDSALVVKTDLNAADASWGIGIDSGAYTYGHAVTFSRSTTGSVLDYGASLSVEYPEIITAGTDWYCVVVTRIGNVFTLYLGKENAGVMTTDTVTEAITLYDNSTTPVTIGTYLNAGGVELSYDMEGYIDELGFWSRGFSECEVYKFYNAGLGRAYSTYDSAACL